MPDMWISKIISKFFYADCKASMKLQEPAVLVIIFNSLPIKFLQPNGKTTMLVTYSHKDFIDSIHF